jgi:hypothetical protein
MRHHIVSLCDVSHNALAPWAAAGWTCTAVDTLPYIGPPDGVYHVVCDVHKYTPPSDATMFLAWPPCTHLANSGAQWWARKGPGALSEALGTVARCVEIAGLHPYVIENPVGRLSTHWRRPDCIVQPWQFAALVGPEDASNPEAYSKATCLWLGNGAQRPVAVPWDGPVDKRRVWMLGSRRASLGSITPRGLSQALFLANGNYVGCP